MGTKKLEVTSVAIIWLPTFMVGERHTPLGTASLLTALMVAANIPGNLTGGALMHRGFKRGTNVCLAGLATALTCLVIFAPALPATIDRVNRWARGLDSKGFVLAPVSALVRR